MNFYSQVDGNLLIEPSKTSITECNMLMLNPLSRLLIVIIKIKKNYPCSQIIKIHFMSYIASQEGKLENYFLNIGAKVTNVVACFH